MPASKPSTRWTGVGALVAGASAGALGWLALDNADRYERYRQSDGAYALPPTYSDAAFAADIGRTAGLNRATIAVGGVAIVATAVSVWLYLRGDGGRVTLAPQVGGGRWLTQF